MKTFNIVWAVLFVLFALVQYNDPDPWLWVALYLYGAALCFFAAQRRNYPSLNLLGIGVYSLYALYLFFSPTGVWVWMQHHGAESIVASMQADKPWIEETREFFGLLILLAVVTLNMVWMRRERLDNASQDEKAPVQ